MTREYFNDIAILKPVIELDETTINLGTYTRMADVRMDTVRKVERGTTGRKILNFARWSKNEHRVTEHI